MAVKTRSELAQFIVAWRSLNQKSQRDLGLMVRKPASLIAKVESDTWDLPIAFLKEFMKHLSYSEKQRLKQIILKIVEKNFEKEWVYLDQK